MGRMSDSWLNTRMKLISVNVSEPRTVVFDGRTVVSSIWKEPADGPVAVGAQGLAGNRLANRNFHGGDCKAAYAYSADLYSWWSVELDRDDLAPGMFGENLTVSGLDEERLHIGDHLLVGDVAFQITGPRIPCSNLAAKFEDHRMPERFGEAGRPGVYLKVLREGQIAAGQEVTHRDFGSGPDIATLFRAVTHPRAKEAEAVLRQALQTPGIDPDLVKIIGRRLLKEEPV